MAMQAKVLRCLLWVCYSVYGNMNSFEEAKKNCFFQKYIFSINRSLNYKLHFFSEAEGEVFTLPISPLATLSRTYLVF